MDIVFLGRSAFRLRGKDVTVVTDPYPPGKGPGMGKLQANIITASTSAPERSFVSGVDGVPRVIQGPGEYEVAGVLIHGVATHREPGTGPTNTAYVLRMDDLVVCHLGSVSGKLTNEQVEELGNVDIVMVPVGANGTLEPTTAAEVVAQLEPSLVIPMEFREGGVGDTLEPVEHFCREMGVTSVTPEPRVSVTKSSLPSDTRVVVLEPKKG